MSLRDDVVAVLEGVLADNELDWEAGVNDGEYVVTLPGEKKLKTVTSLTVGENDLITAAFVIRQPDENHLDFYKFLLRRNLKLPGLAYSIDASGDVYVGGRVPLAAVDEREHPALVVDAAELLGRRPRGAARARRLPSPGAAGEVARGGDAAVRRPWCSHGVHHTRRG